MRSPAGMSRLPMIATLFAGIAAAGGPLFANCPISFTPPFDYALGSNAASLVAGDFNGDGKMDLAVGDQNGNVVWIVLGNGDGTFQSATSYGVGTGPGYLAVGDFNGDGKLDLAVANFNSGTLSILVGNGDGTFAAAGTYLTGSGPNSIVVADLNGDGKPDIAVTNFNDGSASVFLGNGDASFGPALVIPAIYSPAAIATGDFNKDGHPDLAVVSSNYGVTVLFGNGDGTFPTSISYWQGYGTSVAVTDLNGDGNLDFLLEQSPNFSVFLGNGDGTFQPPSSFATGLSNGAQLAVGDFNADGLLDVAVAGGASISILLGNGDGAFQNPSVDNFGNFEAWLVLEDFNGDGKLDVACTAAYDPISVLLNTTSILTISPVLLSSGTLGVAYSASLSTTGGASPYTFAVTSGAIPPGLSLTSSGALSGVPSRGGDYPFTATSTDSNGCTGIRTYDVEILCAVTITVSPLSFTAGVTGQAYSQTVTATGGTAPYGFAVTAGTLPPGLTLFSSGSLSGTPITAGSFSFTITATDANGCSGSQPYSVIVTCPTITVAPPSLPSAAAGSGYSQTLSGGGGSAPYSLAVTSGSLPPGLSLNPSTGLLAGTLTSSVGSPFSFTVTANDTYGCPGSRAYSITVNCPAITSLPNQLPQAVAGSAYNQVLSGSGGTAPYSFVVSSGSLPSGLTLSASGLLAGTPITVGSSSFAVTTTDAYGCSGSLAYTLTTICPTVGILPSSLPAGAAGVGYSQSLGGAGGLAPYSFALASGSLPSGLTISSAGQITGIPTTGGNFSFAVGITDSNGCPGTQSYVISILTVTALSVNCGADSGGTSATVSGTGFQPGINVTLGGAAATVTAVSSTAIEIMTPAGTPGTVADLSVADPGSPYVTLSAAFVYDFLDVPGSNPFHDFVCKLARNAITAGCGSGNFCPSDAVLRSSMAVFLLRGEHGASYTPPPAVGLFIDVPASNPFAPWIEGLYNEAITGGCSTNPLAYCPGNPVTRAAMAVFLLRAKNGPTYSPPTCTGIFADVACPGPFTDWIEALYAAGITGGCSTSPLLYCPAASVTRAQMAVFLTATFNLQ